MVDRRENIGRQDKKEKQQGNRLDIIASIIAMANNIRLDADVDLLDDVGLEDVNCYEYTNNLVYEDHIAHSDDLVYEEVPQPTNDPIYDVYDYENSIAYGNEELDDVFEDLQEARNLTEDLINMPATAQYEDVQVNQDDSFISDRDYDEYSINDPNEERDNLDEEAEDDEDQEDQGEEDEGPHFTFILVDVSIPVGLYTTFLLYTPKINVLKQPFKEKKKKKMFDVLLYFSNPFLFFIFKEISHTRTKTYGKINEGV